MPYFSNDDIAQIGTPPGNAPIGAIRVSGPNAFAIVGRIAPDLADSLHPPVTRGIHNGHFALSLRPMGTPRGGTHETTAPRITLPCPARFLLMPAPASYTREDVVEIHLPGSGVLLHAAMDALVKAGARAAAPGEFTFRAFRGGRVNLGQAEAVEDVIRAGNDRERRQALMRLGDRGREDIRVWRDELLDIAAALEAVMDFSEEELEEETTASLSAMAERLTKTGDTLAGKTNRTGNDKPHVALTGLTNAGKSSLFNALIGEDAVLVSPETSTTRDSLRREVCWDETALLLSDNPGYDAGGTGAGGVAASVAFSRMGGEDIACWVMDASQPLGDDDARFAARLPHAAIIVLNKTDLPSRLTREEALAFASAHSVAPAGDVAVSAITGNGITALRSLIAATARNVPAGGRWSRREAWELGTAVECCRAAADELAGAGRLELAAEDVRRGVTAFSRALGEGYAEETLKRIFSRFCIGK